MPWTVTALGYDHYGSHQPWGDGTAPPSVSSPDPSSVPPYVNPAANATTKLYDPSPRDPRRELASRSLGMAMSDARNQVLPSPEVEKLASNMLASDIAKPVLDLRAGRAAQSTLDLRETMFAKQEFCSMETRLNYRSRAFVQVGCFARIFSAQVLTSSLLRCSV